MPLSDANVIPALPLNYVPPSPRSDVSTPATERSRAPEGTICGKQPAPRIAGSSTEPHLPFQLPWKSDPTREFPKRRSRYRRRHATARRGGETQSSRPPSSSNASTGVCSDMPNNTKHIPKTTSLNAVIMPALPKQQPKAQQPARTSSPPSQPPASQQQHQQQPQPQQATPMPPVARSPPKSWSALVSQNIKPTAPNRAPLSVNRIPNGKMGGLAAALASFDPFAIQSSMAPIIRPRGLINTGNLCFMNVVLQALLFCPPFYNLLDTIQQHVAHKFASQTPLLDSLIDFLREFEIVDPASQDANPNGPVVGQEHIKDFGDPFIPERVYNAWKRNKDFELMKRGNQEDAEEFLGLLLNAVHDEFLLAFKSLPAESQRLLNDHYEVQLRNGDVESDGVHIRVNNVNSEDGWNEIGPRHKVSTTRTQLILESPVTRIFTGTLRSVVRKPGHKDSVTLEPYLPLQLDIQDHHIRSVTDALRHITATETLNTDFDGTGRPMTRKTYIEKLPPILILHLKRFVFDGSHGTRKVWKKIAYPVVLDVPLDVLSPGQRAENQPCQFHLFGVIYHHGTSATGGHYTADVLLQDGRIWLNLDDTKLKWVKAQDVAVPEKDAGNWGDVDQHNHGDEGWNNIKNKVAYILLYKRVHS